MIKIDSDLKDIVISALRYSLGRRTYISLETSQYIMKHPELVDKRVKQVMLNDLNEYFNMRDTCYVLDDKCDYDSWITLKEWLESLGDLSADNQKES